VPDTETLIGFWSYTRADAQNSGGSLDALRELLARELRLAVGQRPPTELWHDTSSIPYGKEWEISIRQAIERSIFFIPIVTPSFMQSEWCCKEVLLYLDHHRRMGRPDLVFPIFYIDTTRVDPENEEQCHDSNVYDLLRSLQGMKFERLRNEPIADRRVKMEIERLAWTVRDAALPLFRIVQTEERERARLMALQEEARRRAEEAACQAEEKRRVEEAARQAEEKRRVEEAARQAEEKRRVEEAARQAEKKRRVEEAARQAEEKRRAEEAARRAEEKRRAEEAARQAEVKRRAEEAARQAEEKRRAEEAARQAEVKRRAEEAARQAEEKRRVEEAARQAEEKRRADEAARRAEEKRRADEAVRRVKEKHRADVAARLAAARRRAAEEMNISVDSSSQKAPRQNDVKRSVKPYLAYSRENNPSQERITVGHVIIIVLAVVSVMVITLIVQSGGWEHIVRTLLPTLR